MVRRLSRGVRLVQAERERQLAKGWSSRHDDERHMGGALVWAAICYAASSQSDRVYVRSDYARTVSFSDPWPWRPSEDARPFNGNVLKAPTKKESLRLLVKAGALIAAEIDRRLRDERRSKRRRS